MASATVVTHGLACSSSFFVLEWCDRSYPPREALVERPRVYCAVLAEMENYPAFLRLVQQLFSSFSSDALTNAPRELAEKIIWRASSRRYASQRKFMPHSRNTKR